MILRDQLIEVVKKEIVGPCEGQNEEKEIISESPLIKYITGVLEPYEPQDAKLEDNQDGDIEEEDEDVEEENVAKLASSTSISQSSFGFSFFINSENKHPLKIKVMYGMYSRLEGGSFQRQSFKHEVEVLLNAVSINKPSESYFHDGKLLVAIHERDASNRFFDFSNKRLLTLSIRNLLTKEKEERASYEDCFFQVELAVTVNESEPFLPYPEYIANRSEDDTNNQLLYRDVKNYANGHGCSVDWKVNERNEVTRLASTFVPQYELFPLNHREINGLELEMLRFYKDTDGSYAATTLQKLLDEYEEWIFTNEQAIPTLKDTHLKEQAKLNVQNCKAVLLRMRTGLRLLKEEPVALEAFRYMNWSMLFQQIRYGLEERPWKWNGENLEMEAMELPQVELPVTWPDYDARSKRNKKLGKWRPFQVAFVLMNLESIFDGTSPDREIIDLIWFPTGGGKTEAYLGLTAFTILYNRLTGKKSKGTEVIMRYTLRLLTTEQFQRAASLICACEILRQEQPGKLGKFPITIGLWVGGEVTPNRNKRAIEFFENLSEAKSPYVFVLLKCPCCGKRMGKIKKGHGYTVKGIVMQDELLKFTCYGDCEFNGQKLPIEVVDDYIYADPCTLVIATVDKFAQLPWEPRSRKILGVDFPKEGNYNPPTLIIQDELHLISGPLGSLVGLYETLIEYLMTGAEDDNRIKPKIVASTATIALAKDQIKALYGREGSKICVYPTPCLDHNDNFFAFLDNTGSGRKYVGIYANSSPSFKTTQVRVMSILLQAPYLFKEEYKEAIDPYYTLVTYFNRTKDLAHAVTFCDDGIVYHENEARLSLVPSDAARCLYILRRRFWLGYHAHQGQPRDVNPYRDHICR